MYLAAVEALYGPGTKFDREKGAFIGKTIPDPGDPTKKRKLELSGEETVVQDIRKALDANPRINHVMIWHETAPGYGIPEELLGWEVPETTDRNRSNAAFLNEAGRIIRKHFPNLLIQVGNSSAQHLSCHIELPGGDPGQAATLLPGGDRHPESGGLEHPHGSDPDLRGEVVGEGVHEQQHRVAHL